MQLKGDNRCNELLWVSLFVVEWRCCDVVEDDCSLRCAGCVRKWYRFVSSLGQFPFGRAVADDSQLSLDWQLRVNSESQIANELCPRAALSKELFSGTIPFQGWYSR
jgi:hypothetical protein